MVSMKSTVSDVSDVGPKPIDSVLVEKILKLKGNKEDISLRANEHSSFKTDIGHGCLYVREGYLRVGFRRSSHIQTVRIAGPGELIGFGTWLHPEKYVGIALTHVKASHFDKLFFFDKLLSDNEIAQGIFHSTISQIIFRDERICTLQNPTVKGRIAGTLISLADKFNTQDHQGRLQIPPIVDRKILAELSGTVVETLARALTEFQKKEIIQRQGKTIIINNYQALLNISDK